MMSFVSEGGGIMGAGSEGGRIMFVGWGEGNK